jgi:hypothetical protein
LNIDSIFHAKDHKKSLDHSNFPDASKEFWDVFAKIRQTKAAEQKARRSEMQQMGLSDSFIDKVGPTDLDDDLTN